MNTRQLKINELGLLLQGLRSIMIVDEEPTRQKLMTQLETELAARGATLAGESQVIKKG